jgi:hypothetical protein
MVDRDVLVFSSNQLCLLPDSAADGGCDGGFLPTTGGLINVSKTNDLFYSSIGSSVEKDFGVTTINSKVTQYTFSARPAGSVLGVAIDSTYIGSRMNLSVYATGKVKKTSPFLDPKILRTLQQTSGTK